MGQRIKATMQVEVEVPADEYDKLKLEYLVATAINLAVIETFRFMDCDSATVVKTEKVER
jgi:N-acyl-L-homoserine lactone synthetase